MEVTCDEDLGFIWSVPLPVGSAHSGFILMWKANFVTQMQVILDIRPYYVLSPQGENI